MLTFMTLLVMLIVAYASFREGLFTAFATLVNVVLTGLITYNFWEPLAGSLDSTLQGSVLDGYQDFVMIVVPFAILLGLLRMVTNNLANSVIEFSPTLQQFGGAGIGLVTGYLLAGFLICALETLPWHKNFIDFAPRTVPSSANPESDFRRILPPDRVWLALMRHAGAYGFARSADNEHAESPYDRYATFDRAGTFELRYFRYRRYSDTDDPQRYMGELDLELKGPVNVPLPPAPPVQAAPPPSVTPQPQKDAAPAPEKTPDGKANVPPPSGPGKDSPSK
jgi:uncharacterized membrane protein required for colicin V production